MDVVFVKNAYRMRTTATIDTQGASSPTSALACLQGSLRRRLVRRAFVVAERRWNQSQGFADASTVDSSWSVQGRPAPNPAEFGERLARSHGQEVGQRRLR